jgi:flagellar biosynthesis component FlhA
MENIQTLQASGMLTEELKESVRVSLHSQQVQIVFVKTDGTLREMRATLDLDNLISEEYHPKNEKERKKNPDVQVVFDLDKNEWRSFRWDKLVSVD